MVDAMDRTRALTHGLVPANMKAGDPRPTLQTLAQQVQLRFGVKVLLAFHGTIPSHELAEMLQLYRIAQEAISNALRHGRANCIKLDLRRLHSSMQLTVRDNGIGFPDSKSPHEGIGLQIMRHRASLLGGGVHVGNAPRRGVLLKLQYQPSVLT
jgi:signal transduction histidine kinase